MIVSMTAYGREEGSGSWGQASCEIRTVNHRYLEMSIRLPEELRALEQSVRDKISSRLKRGKIDCAIRHEQIENIETSLSINQNLVSQLIESTESIAKQIKEPVSLNPMDILRWPNVIEKNSLDPDSIGASILELLDNTLDTVIDTRQREGKKIKSMISERCITVRQKVTDVRINLPEIMDCHREKLLSRANELNGEIDHDRLEQEMLILAQKYDVAEELDRLDTHIEEVTRVMEQEGPVGRRLDFLMQEMNREANTLGSKSTHINTSNASVDLKVLIEQMREQIQNIE